MKLIVKASVLGRRLLDEIETLLTPDTRHAWHRKLITKKWTPAGKGWGRPRVTPEITDGVLVRRGSMSPGTIPIPFQRMSVRGATVETHVRLKP